MNSHRPLFAAQLWQDFYRSAITHTMRKATSKLLLMAAVLILAPGARAATPSLDLVIAVDLSRSVSVKGPDGKTEFQKNVDGVTKVLAQLPAGARVSIIGITDHSFTQPYILLSATLSQDPGFFGERLAAARVQTIRVWQKRAAKSQPRFPGTDIIGALFLASHIFQQVPELTRELVIFSDMRNHAAGFNQESNSRHPRADVYSNELDIGRPNLKDVKVYAVGVDGAGEELDTWTGLQMFWSAYLSKCGAEVKSFSAIRDVYVAAFH